MDYIKKNIDKILFLLLTVCFTLIFFQDWGVGDVRLWLKWMDSMEKFGIRATYAGVQEFYPPLSYLLLFIAAKAGKLFGLNLFISLKVSLVFCLFLTSATFYLFSRNFLLTMLVQLSLTLSSIAYGYLDIYFAPFLILSLYALKDERYVPFSFFFTISFLIKWQPIILLPFALVYALGISSVGDILKIEPRRAASLAIPFVLILVVLTLVFGMAMPRSLIDAGRDTIDGYLSGNALNFNWILTYILHTSDPIRYGGLLDGATVDVVNVKDMPGALLFLVKALAFGFYAVVFVIYFFQKGKDYFSFLGTSLLAFLAYFIFYTNVHENHLFIISILAALMYSIRKDYIFWFLIWGFMANINLLAFYTIPGISVPSTRIVGGLDTTVLLSILNLILFIVLFVKAVCRKDEVAALGEGT